MLGFGDLLQRWNAAKREVPLSAMLPYSSFITEHDLVTRGGEFVRFFELEAVPFETASPEQILALHLMMCAWLATFNEDFGIYFWRTQFYEDIYIPPVRCGGYSQVLDQDMTAWLRKRPFLNNRIFIAIVYKPRDTSTHRSRAQIERDQQDALQAMRERTASTLRMLHDFSPRLLGNEQRGEREFSRPAEVASLLVNGSWMPVLAGRGPLYRRLPAVRVSAANGVVELGGIADTRYAVMLDVLEYADEVEPGYLAGLLYESMEYIESQSFLPLNRRAAMKSMELQLRQLEASGDKVQSQIDELRKAIDQVGGGEMGWGEHFLSVAVLAASLDEAKRSAARAAGTLMETTGIRFVLDDMLADSAWLAQCPGNTRRRSREARISSRAFAAMNAGHGFYRGKAMGNPWGPRIMDVRSPSGSVIHLSFHASPLNEDSFGLMLPGNTAITGRTRTGKTVWEAAMLILSRRLPVPPRIIVFDKDRGLEIAVRLMGGTYMQLKANEPTGVNPLQWPVTNRLRVFLVEWIRALIHDPALPLQPAELADLERTVATVLDADWSLRHLTSVHEMLPVNGPNGAGNTMRARLARWIRGGALGWVFDAADDRLPNKLDVAGYDYTEFLELPDVRTPMVMTLLEYGERFVDGSPFIQVVAETWRAALDPLMRRFMHDKAKTIGKLGGAMVMDTQEPDDLVDLGDGPDAIGNTLVTQVATIVCFHDDMTPDAAYRKTLGLTAAELHVVRTLAHRGSRRFLFKQNGQSVVCEFDLSEMPEHLIALASNAKNVRLLDAVRAEVGDDPEVWWPVLLQRIREREERARFQTV
jgi:type IV secretion system protein VirB4